MNGRHTELLSNCLSIDLEVDPKTAKVFAFAAVRNDEQPALKSKSSTLEKDLDRLEEAIAGVPHPIGPQFPAPRYGTPNCCQTTSDSDHAGTN